MKSFFLQSWRALMHQNCDYVKCFSSTVSQNKILLHLLYWACHVFGSQYFILARSWDYCTDDLRLKLHLSPSATPPDWLGVQKQSEQEKQAKMEVANTKYSQQFVEKLFFMKSLGEIKWVHGEDAHDAQHRAVKTQIWYSCMASHALVAR